jgi:hypothetical protein
VKNPPGDSLVVGRIVLKVHRRKIVCDAGYNSEENLQYLENGWRAGHSSEPDQEASLFFSRFETTITHEASPVILTVVLPISNILSTPATSAMPSTGKPTDFSTIASMTIPAPGTPAVPMEARVAVATIVSICPNVRSMPKQDAMKIEQTPWYIAVPSMLIVAPRGRTNDETSFGAPSFSVHSMLIGNVPTDEALEKANIIAGSIPLKNWRGLILPAVLTAIE